MVRALISAVLAFALVASAAEPPRTIRIQRSSPQLPGLAEIQARTEAYRAVLRRERAPTVSAEQSARVAVLLEEARSAAGQPPGGLSRLVSCVLPSEEQRQRSISAHGKLEAARAAVRQGLAESLIHFDALEARLQAAPNAAGVMTRLAAERTRLETRAQEMERAIAEVSGSMGCDTGSVWDRLPGVWQWGRGLGAVDELDSLRTRLSDWGVGRGSGVLSADLTYVQGRLQPGALPTESIVPAYLAGGTAGFELEDTTLDREVEQSSEIRTKAEALGSAKAAYDFVRNELRLDWYYGSLKGATETLREGRGNDADLAALLVSLLRAQGTPARFVEGTIELSEGKIADLLGLLGQEEQEALYAPAPGGAPFVLTDAKRQLVLTALGAIGVPFEPVVSGGQMMAVRLSHIWVEAYLPVSDYRGAGASRGGRQWVPLEPSISGGPKYVATEPDLDVLTAMGASAESLTQAYLQQGQGSAPLVFWRNQVTQFLKGHSSGLTYEQVLRKVEKKPEELPLLPGALPYRVVSVQAEHTFLPEERKHRLHITAHDGAELLLDVTLPMHLVMGHRAVFTYEPATDEDKELIFASGGLYNAPASVVDLLATFRIDGVNKARATRSVGLGTRHRWTLEMLLPDGSKRRVENEIIAGNQVAIGLGAPFDRHVEPTPKSLEDLDTEAARFLYLLAASYVNSWTESEEALSHLTRVVPVRPTASLVLVENQLEVKESFGVRQQVEWKGLEVDADLRSVTPLELVEGRGATLLRLSGYEGSFLEAKVLTDGTGEEAVSAVTLIQEAYENSLPVLRIDPGNVGTELGKLQAPPAVFADVSTQVANGREVLIPQKPLTIRDWEGTGFIARDPETGEGGYFLSGRISGGQTVVSPDSWLDRELADYLEANAPDSTNDTRLIGHIIKVPDTDLQQGTVGEALPKEIAVYVTTTRGQPVRGALVTFRTADLSKPRFQKAGDASQSETVTVQTNRFGRASVKAFPDTNIGRLGVFWPGDPNQELHGFNAVTAEVATETGSMRLAEPLWFTAKPGPLSQLINTDPTRTYSGEAGVEIGLPFEVKAADQYGNVLANKTVTWSSNDAASRFFIPESGKVTRVQFLGSDPKQEHQKSQLSLVTPTSGLVVVGFIPVTPPKVTVFAQSGTVTQTFTVNSLVGKEFTFRLATPDTAGSSGVFGASVPKPFILEILQRNESGSWTRVKGNEPEVRANVIVGRVTADRKLADVKTTPPYALGSGATGEIDLDDNVVAWPTYDVENGMQEMAFFAQVFKKPYGYEETQVCCDNRFVSAFYSGVPEVEVKRLRPGGAEEPLNPCGQLAPDDQSLRLNLTNPGTFPIYARILQRPEIAGTELFKLPPPDVIERDPVDASRLLIPPGATIRIPLELTVGSGNGQAEVEFYAPDFRIGSEARTQLKRRDSYTFSVRKELGGVGSSARELRASIVLAVRNFAAARTPKDPDDVTPVRVPKPIFRPAQLPLCINETGRLEVRSGTALIAGAQVMVQEDGRVDLSELEEGVPVPDHPSNGSLRVVVPPGDPSGQQVVVKFSSARTGGTQSQDIPLITTVEDASALPVGHTFVKDVSTVDGHLVKQSVDLEVQGRAPGLQLVRSYTNRGHDGGPLGLGWTHSYRGYVLPSWDADLNVARYMVVGGEGTGQVFECKPGPTQCVSQDGFHGTFRAEVEGSGADSRQLLVYRAKNGTEYRYGPVISTIQGLKHQLLSVRSPAGNEFTFEYEGPGTDYEVGRVYEPGRKRFLQFSYGRVSGVPRALLSTVELYLNPSAPNVLSDSASPEHLGVCIAYLYNTQSMLAAAQRYDGPCPESLEGQTPPRQESYTYVDSPLDELRNNLASWTDANDNTTSYVYYQPEDRLPGESDFLRFGNKSERIRYVNEPEGATTEFIYSLERKELQVFGSPITAFVTEVKGPRPEVARSTRYYMGLDGTVARTERPLSEALTATTSSRWDPLHMRRDSETDARSRGTAFKYDGFGNLIERRIALAPLPASGDGEATESVKDGQDETKVHSEVVEKWSYDPAFSVPVCSMDAEGRITRVQLDSNGVDPRTGTVTGTGLVLSTRRYAQTVDSAERTSTKTCLELAENLSPGLDDIVQHRTWCKVDGVLSCPEGALPGDALETWIEGASASERIQHTRIAAYDSWGLPSVQVAYANDSQELKTNFLRNKRGLTLEQKDTFGHYTEWTYDGLDRVKSTTRRNTKVAGGPHLSVASPSIVQTFDYYPGGQLKSEKNDSISFERRYVLDGLNRVKNVRESGQGLRETLVTTYEYDKAGNRTHVTDRRGVTTITTYDWGDRPIRTSVRVLEGAALYGLRGGVNGSASEVDTATFGYDAVGNKVYETNLHGQRTDYVLDSLYRVVRTQAPSVPGASFASVLPVRYELTARYDLVGNPTKKKDGNGHLTRMAYDFANRLVSTVDAEGREERQTYDHAGNPRVLEKRTGSTVHLTRTTTYDGLNRPVHVEEEYLHPNANGSFVPRERHIETRYTDAENTVTVKDARGFVTTTVKDDLDRVIRVVVDDGDGKLPRTPDEEVGPALSLTSRRGYDSNGNLTTEVDPLDRKTTYAYDALKRLLETRRPMDATESLEYDGEGAVIGRVDVRGIRREFTFDMFRRPVTDRLVESLSNSGATLDLLTRTYVDQAGPDGVTSVEEKDARDNTTRRYLDALGRELSVVDAKGKAQVSRYDAVNVRERRDRKGYRTLLRYDKAGRLKAQDDEDIVNGSAVVKYRQSILYEDALQRETLTDRRGIPLVKQKDGLGRVVRTIRGISPLLQKEETEYSDRDEVVAVIDANLHRKEWLYDGAGRKLVETLGAGTSDAATTRYTYDKAGNLVAWKGPRTPEAVTYDERNSFDGLNRLVRRENALGHVWASAYDKAGNKLCEKRPLGGTTLTHGDTLGMSIEAIQTAVCLGDYVTKYEYDELGKLTRVTDAGEGQYTFVYDKARNLVAKQDANGNLTTYEFDERNLREAEHQHLDAHPRLSGRASLPGPEAKATSDGETGTLTWKWTYDANGNVETETDPKGQVTTSIHGVLNRLVSRSFSSPVTREKPYVEAQSFEYDENGNQTLIKETKQTLSGPELKQTRFDYDKLDRLWQQARYYGNKNAVVTYKYDDKGNRTEVRDADNVTTTYTYDALDRLKTAVLDLGRTEYFYWPDGLLRLTTYPNNGVTEARCYDNAGRLSKQLTARGSINDDCSLGDAATLLGRSEYGYDNNGNRNSLKELRTNPADQALGAEERTEYGYDELDRLTGTRTPEGKAILYRLDAVGNRTGEKEVSSADVTSLGPEAYEASYSSLSRDVTYALNRADWLRTSTDVKDAARNITFGYDLNGNLVSKVKGGITRTFAWDVRNTLTVVREGTTPATATEVGRYDYDANLQRVSRKTAAENVSYVLDDEFVLQELDAAQTSQPAKRRYHYAAGPLAVSEISGGTNTRILHTDSLGSVTDVTSDTGSVSISRKYDAWGSYRGGTAPLAADFKLGYTGHQYDPETGLTYARARYYDSDLGRFISRDLYEGQLNDAPSLHRYIYGSVNPLRFIDPTGHFSWEQIKGWAAEDWNDTLVTLGLRSAQADPRSLRPIERTVQPKPKLKEFVAVESRDKPGAITAYEREFRGQQGQQLLTFMGEYEKYHENRLRSARVRFQGTMLVAGVGISMAVPAAAPLLVETAGVSTAGAAGFLLIGETAGGVATEYGMTGRVTPEGVLMSAGMSGVNALGSMKHFRSLEEAAAARSAFGVQNVDEVATTLAQNKWDEIEDQLARHGADMEALSAVINAERHAAGLPSIREGLEQADVLRNMAPRPPTREEMLESALGVLRYYDDTIREVFGLDVQYGIRGSLSTGTRYSTGGPFNPADFDVDALVVHKQLPQGFSREVMSNTMEVMKLEEMIEADLRSLPGFENMRDDPSKPFCFRCWKRMPEGTTLAPVPGK
ncbi:RHS repeat-associated core domain-containing protein [Archangium lipolyticum]|uniref:RHS repeat-associated core domain-containing protein n=1 Tax=Archangium lipolyticum TaxID=2970465 RepID=UPI00214A416B|nr:RHS repeat-associated core domain-containing protein [Archangium lipolyticum]